MFIAQSFFAISKKTRLNSTYYFNKNSKQPVAWNFQQIAINHFSDIDTQFFRKNIKSYLDDWKKNLEIKNSSITLIKKQKKYQHYHQAKLIKINILHVKRYYTLIKVK